MDAEQRNIPTHVLSQRAQRRSDGSEDDPCKLIGQYVDGRYEVLRLIARGGMGCIYEARQQPLQRLVALKVLLVKPGRDESFERRFHREAFLASKLSHPNVVTTYDYGQTTRGQLYIAMEYLRGRTLERRLGEEGPLSIRDSLNIAQQVAQALGHAHRKNMVHRDLKPSNIMLLSNVDELDFAKILDFGLAKPLKIAQEDSQRPMGSPPPSSESKDTEVQELTMSGMLLGTPGYMAPEQFSGLVVDARTDVYALGVVLYECLVGGLPFAGGSPQEHATRQLAGIPPTPIATLRPDIDGAEEIDALLWTMLDPNPDNRLTDGDAVVLGLRKLDTFRRRRRTSQTPPAFDPDESEGLTVCAPKPRGDSVWVYAQTDEKPSWGGPRVIVLAMIFAFVVVSAVFVREFGQKMSSVVNLPHNASGASGHPERSP